MNSEPPSEPNYGILVHRFMISGQWERSLTTALEWLAREPENLRIQRIIAQSLINLKRPAEAEKHLEKVLAGRPSDGFAHRLMAMVYFSRGAFRAADESIRKAISLNPRDAYHWYQLALMSYRHGDLATAKKSAEQARELNPRDANILNLLILCEPNDQGSATQKILQYEAALELDPKNPNLHNNLGTQYLNRVKDYARAEECFRRALFFEPASELSRKNLFITLKKRDLIYQILCTPKDWLVEGYNFFIRMRKKNILLYILMIPLWLLAFRFILGGLVLWFALIWPLTHVYEYLTIGDIRARAGEFGVRRGGFLGYRRWPLKIRLAIFAGVLVSFWGGIFFLCTRQDPLMNPDLGKVAVGLLIGFGVLVLLPYYLTRRIQKGMKARAVRQRARHMKGFLTSTMSQKADHDLRSTHTSQHE